MNYDPNLMLSGKMAKQTIVLKFQMWDYTKTVEHTVTGNIPGFLAIEGAVSAFYETLPTVRILTEAGFEDAVEIVLENPTGDTMTCEDGELEGEDWLKDMLVSAEIIAIEPER